MVILTTFSRMLLGVLQMASLDLHPGARFGCLRSDQPLLERAAKENAICVIIDVLGKSKVLLEVLTRDGYRLDAGEVEVSELSASELYDL